MLTQEYREILMLAQKQNVSGELVNETLHPELERLVEMGV